jgi:hypothetical protein
MLFYMVILLYLLNCSLAIGSAIKLRAGRNRSLYPSLIKFIK